MATYSIQNNLEVNDYPYIGKQICLSSTGRLYTAYNYNVGAVDYLTVAYSDDSGVTWNEVKTALDPRSTACALDSADILHIVYFRDNYFACYRTFSEGVFGSEEVIFDGTSTTSEVESISIAVDSNDVPHVGFIQEEAGGTDELVYYSNRSTGSWAARTLITGTSNTHTDVRIYIDPSDIIWLFYIQMTLGSRLQYAKYETFWTSPVTVPVTGDNSPDCPSAVIDTSGNVYLAWADNGLTPDAFNYIKYTKSTDSWGATGTIYQNAVLGLSTGVITLGMRNDNTLFAVFNESNTGDNIYYSEFNGSTWSAPAVVYNNTSAVFSCVHTPFFPFINGLNTSRPTAGYFLSIINSSDLYFHIATGTTLQTPVTKNYSRGDVAALPTSDVPLENLFTTSEYTGVATDNDVYVSQTATNEYTVIKFKNKAANSSDEIHVSWRGKSSLAPSSSAVVLQIYNRSGGSWETLTSDNSSPADTEFTLTASKTTNLNQYYDGNNWVSFRVYQLAQ